MPIDPQHAAVYDPKRSNRKAAWLIVGLVVAMLGLSFASVPLYRLFCQVTGFGGTPKVVSQLGQGDVGQLSNRRFTIRFNADHAPNLRVDFRPLQPQVSVQAGQAFLAHYRLVNQSDKPVTVMASYNVTPEKIAPYFNKIQCFCFQEQHLDAGQTVDLPVSFFVDTEVDKDTELADLHSVTLSYTYFEVKEGAKAQKDAAARSDADTNSSGNSPGNSPATPPASPPDNPAPPNPNNNSALPSGLPNHAPAS
ncbi:MAG: cytochrome c oxidase assembly protein [Alphaproteobacteria bacterium]|nr:cytochrome c oxidase assembly protein [Alphaproteobacteria bacterium]